MGRDNALGVASVKAPQPLDALGAQPLFTETGQQSPADYLYYSFTTLTTTGYGDLTTESDVGRAASILEALVGQIYLVTVVRGSSPICGHDDDATGFEAATAMPCRQSSASMRPGASPASPASPSSTAVDVLD